MTNRIKELKKKLDELKTKQVDNTDAASVNPVVFNPCLSPDTIKEFENRNSILLPEDYKEFLTEIGNGGFGPGDGLLTLEKSAVDFKLRNKPNLALGRQFPYTDRWNEQWISTFDWDEGYPDTDLVDGYIATCHIDGCLQVCHLGHGNTCLLVVNGESYGTMWFDERADYGGLRPILLNEYPATFLDWYVSWLNSLDNNNDGL